MTSGTALLGSSLLSGPFKAKWHQLKSRKQSQDSASCWGPPEVRWPVPNWDTAPSLSGPSTCVLPEKSQAAELLSNPNMQKQMRMNKTKRNRTGRTATTQFVNVNTRKELWDGRRAEQQHPVNKCLLATTGWQSAHQRELQWLQTGVAWRSQGGNQVSTPAANKPVGQQRRRSLHPQLSQDLMVTGMSLCLLPHL